MTTDSPTVRPSLSGGGTAQDRRRRAGDRLFARLTLVSALTILVALAGVALFLIVKGWPALTAPAADIPGDQSFLSYVWPLAFGSMLSAGIAVLIGIPLAIAVSLFIVFYAPRRLAQTLGALVDLLAAIPSIVFGLWGVAVFGPSLHGLQNWLYDNLGFLPFFEGPPSTTGRTMFTAGLVLGVMILPIVSAVTREVFTQTPPRLMEGALALGATRWEMIRMTVLPFGRSAIVGASMLGLGRALGETMAVAIILSISGDVTLNVISSGNPSTIAANIALQFPESSGIAVNVLIASGLVLFGITLVVNMAARAVIARTERGSA